MSCKYSLNEALRQVFQGKVGFENAKFIGRKVYGELSENNRYCCEFTSSTIKDHYDQVRLSVIDKNGGKIDQMVLWLDEQISPRPTYLDNGWHFYLTSKGEGWWKPADPSESQLNEIAENALEYFMLFADQEFCQSQEM